MGEGPACSWSHTDSKAADLYIPAKTQQAAWRRRQALGMASVENRSQGLFPQEGIVFCLTLAL